MDAAAREFLFRLLETPSPSGYERPVQDLVREYLSGIADSVTSDSHGNVIGGKNTGTSPRVLLVGHCDQIGLIVQHIDADGFLWVQPIGGWDPMQLVGSHVVVWTAEGSVPGVISRKPIHLLSDEERGDLENEAGELVKVLESDDTDSIRAVTDQLGQASLTFAERRMDRSIKSALSGVAVSELDSAD